MSLEQEIRAVRTSAALTAGDHIACVRVSGPGAFDAVSRVCPVELTLQDAQMKPTLLLDERGGPFADLYVCRDDESFFLLAEGPSPADLDAYLRAGFPPGAEVTLERLDETHRLLGVHGPYAWELCAALLGPDLPGMPYLSLLHAGDAIWFRGGKTGEYGYDLLVPAARAGEVRAALEDLGRAFDLERASLAALDQCALESWFFNVRREGRAGLSLPELGLQWRVSYRKDYPGAAALADLRRRGAAAARVRARRGAHRRGRRGRARGRGHRVDRQRRLLARPRRVRGRGRRRPAVRGRGHRPLRRGPRGRHLADPDGLAAGHRQPQPLREPAAARVRGAGGRRLPAARPMSARFTGRTVLVTGASRGLGRAIAEAFGREGAFVYVGFRARQAEAEETLRRLREAGGDGAALAIDVRDRAAVEGAVERVVAERGAPSVVVNNAGVARDELFATMSGESWDEVLSVNLGGTFNVCRAVARPMMGRKSGAIVNVASVAGLHASPGQANYAASKGGVIALTRTLAVELAPRGIRVNAVVPGLCAAGMAARLDRRVAEQKRAAIPLGRFGAGDEIARVVLFLASDDAAYVVGQAIVADGGLSA